MKCTIFQPINVRSAYYVPLSVPCFVGVLLHLIGIELVNENCNPKNRNEDQLRIINWSVCVLTITQSFLKKWIYDVVLELILSIGCCCVCWGCCNASDKKSLARPWLQNRETCWQWAAIWAERTIGSSRDGTGMGLKILFISSSGKGPSPLAVRAVFSRF